MLSKFKIVVTGIPDPFKMDNGKTLNFLTGVIPNADGTATAIKLRSLDIDFRGVPILEPQSVEAELKLHSKDGKTTTLEVQQWSLKPLVASK